MLKLKLISGGHGLDLYPFSTDCPKGLFVVVSGKGWAMFSGSRTGFGPGCVFFLDCQTGFVVSEGEVIVGYLLCFDEGYVDYFLLAYPLARALSLFSGLLWLPLGKRQLVVVQERIRVIAADLDRGAGFEQLKLVFALFLLDIVGNRLVVAEPFEEARALMGVFKSLLEENFARERRSGFYADGLCISTRKLNALCRCWYGGRRFDEVIRERLLSEAEFLLLGSDLSIKAVAFGLGFYSLQHFRGWFKKIKGVSPTVFRTSAKALVFRIV